MIDRRAFLHALGATAGLSMIPASGHAESSASIQRVPDLRFGHAPTIKPAPGIDPMGDATALLAPGIPSPAHVPIPGIIVFYQEDSGRRHILRVPTQWNGSLVVAGTPATRSEYAGDAIWSDFVLARGYAYASSNKGIPYNAFLTSSNEVPAPRQAYPIPFNAQHLEEKQIALRFGALSPKRIGIPTWNDDFRRLITFARLTLSLECGSAPKRTYAVGLSNGGAQVRTALERFPELLDGGLEYGGVYWTPQHNLLDLLPPFLKAMPSYVRSNFSDHHVRADLEALGYPADVIQQNQAHPSLWCEYYSNALPFYADVALFVNALLIDPQADANFANDPATPNSENPQRLPGRIKGEGLALPELRATYIPSSPARDAVNAFAHSGAIEKPLISLAGTKDILITPNIHALGYAKAIADAGRAHLHRLYVIENATHIDAFTAFGYGLRPHLPFAWAAFDQLVRTVEHNDTGGAGTTRTVSSPAEIT